MISIKKILFKILNHLGGGERHELLYTNTSTSGEKVLKEDENTADAAEGDSGNLQGNDTANPSNDSNTQAGVAA